MATYLESAPAERGQIRSASGFNLAIGIWLIIAPFILPASATARLNDIVVGIAIVMLATIRVSKPDAATKPASWINVILGLWLLIAPFALNYALPAAIWNDVIAGIAVMIFGLRSSTKPRALGGAPVTTRTSSPTAAGLSGRGAGRRSGARWGGR